MYLPSHFEQNDPAAIAALVAAHPLATLVHHAADGTLAADLLPLQRSADGTRLHGHVARANPLWRHADGRAVLAVFTGAQAYVTPNLYPTKARTHRVVPTWNYCVAQAHGVLRAVPDAPWLHDLVTRLTLQHEAARPQPWAVDDAPADYVAQMLRAIVGIEIEVERWVGKWKVSQNRDAADRDAVADAFSHGSADERELAAAMPARTPPDTAASGAGAGPGGGEQAAAPRPGT